MTTRGAAVVAIVSGLLLASGAAAAADCRDPAFAWSDTEPPVNLRHIFCGEINDGRPQGMHSRHLLATSPVARGIIRRQDEGRGIYSVTLRFANGKVKLSTFFPDACSVEAVTRSIVYAAHHSRGRHRAWGEVGPSAPQPMAAGYCLDDGGNPLMIRFGRLSDGRINTAFPEREGQ